MNPRFPSLDGLRAVAVVLVLLFHANHWGIGFPEKLKPALEFLPGGRWGVALFFYISGFIITYLLLAEEDRRGSISLSRFYIRRSLRILPVYFSYLLVVFAMNFWSGIRWDWTSYLAPLTFTTGSWDHESPYVLAHFWSLAVEWQFYLIWPILLTLLPRASRSGVLIAVVVLMPVIRGVLRRAIPELELIPLANAVDTFAWGGLLAFLMPRISAFFNQFTRVRLCTIELALAGFILIENIIFTRELIPNGLFFLSFARSVAIAAFIALVVCQPDLIISRALNWRFAIMLGTFSYSIYVWQQLFIQPLEGDSSPLWLRFPGNLIASVVAGITSYLVLEKPALRFKEHFSRT